MPEQFASGQTRQKTRLVLAVRPCCPSQRVDRLSPASSMCRCRRLDSVFAGYKIAENRKLARSENLEVRP
jgi:hypothetical protein